MGACACIGNVVLLVPLVPAEKYERKNVRTQADNRGLRPAAIIEKLHLRNAIYQDTATYGHFNSCLFPWEDTSMRLYNELRKADEAYADRKIED
ncbi:S-adenosylmethionine synthase [bioreactor metagenome]|uniref:S-adenosylmethionine synthase n=1 Tax=bioreactor metagenome TaxID=1076179 RepID=A0A644TEU9_9ZZZZ|nr:MULTISPECIES: methionine adenosyltransferase domain-containing protein [Dehalococcoides]MEA4878926.1 methionine adenosyltransferase domain-containing protein [Dehalococcoides mccartyi]